MKEFKTRQEELEKVIRYGTNGEWEPMFYRPNLRIHTTRVYWMVREITKYLTSINPSIFSQELTNELAIFHDDTEIITGDFLSVAKENFSTEQKLQYEQDSLDAIETLSKQYWCLTKHDYKKLLLLDKEKEGIEYLIVAYADKLDAHMEVCHEIFAGNPLFLTQLKQWNLKTRPYNYTKNKILKLEQQLSDTFEISLIDSHPLFMLSEVLDFEDTCAKWVPHTQETVTKKTWYTLYDTWKELHFLYWNSREKEYLYHQIEFT